MKKYLLLILCLVSSLMASAESGTCGDNLTWSLEDGILFISGTGAMTNYYSSESNVPWYSSRSTISLAIISEGVTSIGDRALEGCSILNSVTIPNSVTSIGNWAFDGCSSLPSIIIPNSVTSIGYDAFYGCSNLASITIPNSVTSIGEQAFYECSALTSINIPDGVTSIGEYAFADCFGLTSITIPNSVTSIGGSAFSRCSRLTSITIPNSVTSIGRYAFHDCSGLTSITIPNSVTSIGDYAFNMCCGLTSVSIGNSVTIIGGEAFKGCSGLTSITIPNSVTSIGYNAFAYCSGLTSVTIPNSVTSIGGGAFYKCSGLTSVTIPNSVTSIGDVAFYGCSGLTSVKVLAATPPTCGSDLLFFAGTSTIHVYEGLADVYKAASGWSSYNFVDDIPATRVTGLTLDATRYQCGIGQRFTPQVIAYEPEDATFKEVIWSSSDPSTLTIAANTGACIGLKDGIVTITATAKDAGHATATAAVYVGNVNPEDAVTISASSANSAMGTVSGGGDYLPGATVILTATPARGFEFQSWSDGSTENPYTFTATESKELVANFKVSQIPQILSKTKATTLKPNQWYVITQNRNGESPAYEDVANSRVMRAATSVDVQVGDYFEDVKNYLVRFLPTDNVGIYKLQWGTDHYWFTTSSTNYGSAGILVQTVTDETNAGNYFVYNINGQEGHFGMNLTTNNSTYGLVVDNNGAGNTVSLWGTGKVNSINGNNDWTFYEVEVLETSEVEITATCETEHGTISGSGIYEKGAEVTLTAVPAEGYKFIRWSDGSTENPYTFIATKNKTLTAEFKLIQMTLTDGTAYTNSIEDTYDELTYTRTFNDTKWQALYVPFSMSYEDWCEDFEVAAINMFHQYDNDGDGAFDDMTLEARLVKSGTLKPNYPYLIRAKQADTYNITLNDATLYPNEENSFSCNSLEMEYTLRGTYAGVSGSDMFSNGYYAMGGGSLIQAESSAANLKPYRWYLEMTSRGSQLLSAPARVKVRIMGEGDAEGITLKSVSSESDLVFSLDGRRSQGQTRGLYIVNGRKIVK